MATHVQWLGRYGVIVFAIGFLLVSTWNAFRIGISEIYDAMAETEIDQWLKATEKIEVDGNRVESYLAISHRFNPGNPSTSMNHGRFYEFRALGELKNRKENLRSALHQYTQATSLRPASSVSWAIIAEVKSQLGELDPEFEEALVQSARLGPWEPLAQILVVRTGLRNWVQLSGQMRELVRDAAIRGMLSRAPGRRNKMAAILEKQKFLPLVCPYLPNSDKFSRFCKNT